MKRTQVILGIAIFLLAAYCFKKNPDVRCGIDEYEAYQSGHETPGCEWPEQFIEPSLESHYVK